MAQKPDWSDELFAWADENNIPEEKLRRDKKVIFYETFALDLSGYKLTELPDCIGNLSNLKWLLLNNNLLTDLPNSIRKLGQLDTLHLSNNQFIYVPDCVTKLSNLIELRFNGNKLIKLPKIRGNWGMATLSLNDNNLEELPEWIGDLSLLGILDLNNNKLESIPNSIDKLTKLFTLNLSNNCLKQLPKSIGNLGSGFDKERCEFLMARALFDKTVKVNDKQRFLTTPNFVIDLSSNQLTEIPESISNLKNLNELNLSNNPITKIPESVLQMPNLKIIGLEQLTQSKTNMKTYQQKILFGSPGTGKSYQIDKHIIPYELLIDVEKMPANVIKTVFHPEYTYGDFVGKLMPITVGGNVQYKFYEGHFLKALSQAYKNIIAAQDNEGVCEKVALVIDEINRGNSAAIFGTIFQLLDRNPDGWSSYEVSVNEIIFNRLFELCDLKPHSIVQGKIKTYKFGDEEIEATMLQKKLNCHFENRTIKIPPNLSILASMNTSDSSIYYMDSAFKRRWEWEFIDVDSNTVSADGIAFENRIEWQAFVSKLNTFIKSNHKSIRGIEDKQIGHFFITDEQIQKSSIQNKLMFFLWDSVFNRDKKPLVTLLFGDDKENELITFGDFATQVDLFIDKIKDFNV